MKLPIRKVVDGMGFVFIADADGNQWFEGTGFGTEGSEADIIVTAVNAHGRLVEDIKELRRDLGAARAGALQGNPEAPKEREDV
jgi:hypothetical protein